MRTILPILFIVAAIAMYLMYIEPEIGEVKKVQAEIDKIDIALENATIVNEVINELSEDRSQISDRDVERLAQILPRKSNIDSAVLVHNINTIANASGFVIEQIDYRYSDPPKSDEDIGGTVGNIEFKFTVTATYEKFLQFLRDLERSENLYDVTVTSFSVPNDSTYSYSVTLKKYYIH